MRIRLMPGLLTQDGKATFSTFLITISSYVGLAAGMAWVIAVLLNIPEPS
jgi:hypothetical protein